MFFPNPGIMAAGATERVWTYAEFVNHIEALAQGRSRLWGSNEAWREDGLPVITQAASPFSGNLRGSSWMAAFRGSDSWSATVRVVQHGLASQADFDEQTAAGRPLLIKTVAAPLPSEGFVALSRNGYTSSSNAGLAGTARYCTEILAWVGIRPIRMQPHLGLGPEPYNG